SSGLVFVTAQKVTAPSPASFTSHIRTATVRANEGTKTTMRQIGMGTLAAFAMLTVAPADEAEAVVLDLVDPLQPAHAAHNRQAGFDEAGRAQRHSGTEPCAGAGWNISRLVGIAGPRTRQ